jgi:hypothetical protein
VKRLLLPLLLATLLSAPAHAHKQSESYLSLDASAGEARLVGRWDIALRDLEHALGVDRDGDGAITWGELRSREQAIAQFALAHLAIRAGADERARACPLAHDRLLVDSHVDGAYAVLRFHADCASPPSQVAVDYSLLFDLDAEHRGLLEVRAPGASQSLVLSRDAAAASIELQEAAGWRQLRSFAGEGIWHILHGYDHVLFLLTLLAPAVVLRRKDGWTARESLHDALFDVVKVVTAFTLAHSLTLSLAALDVVRLPSRWVESAIAFTVVLGALNNLWPVVAERRWLMAFAFGLIHGFGFASVLSDLGLERSNLALALFGFNAGVELGQLALVLALAPIAYSLRATWFYRRVFMPAGAATIAAFGAYWFVTRAAGP